METELCALAPADWRVRSVDDVCLCVTSGGTPSRRDSAYYAAGNWPWVKTQELQDGWLDDTEEHITDEAVASSSAKVLPEKTVLVAMYGATVGQLGLLRRPMTCNQACSALIVDPAKADFRYLFFQLLHSRSQLKGLATGAAQQNLSGVLIKSLRFPFPPLPEQRAIAHILGTLDDRIELNRRMNETLEAMARALFKSWFVDFDPVRARAEGHDPGLPKPLADLFPDSFEDSELGEIPKGWEVRPFAGIVEIIGGGTPKTSVAEYWDGEIPWFSVVDAPNGADVWVVDTEKKITREGVENSSTRILPVGTTIISARGTVGRIALVGVPMAMNQSCYGLQGKEDRREFFMYFATRELVACLRQHAHGSVFDTITRDTLAGVSVAAPSAELIEAFETRVGSSMERIRAGLFESRTLAALRDALLPKLISGELRVKDADDLVQEATV